MGLKIFSRSRKASSPDSPSVGSSGNATPSSSFVPGFRYEYAEALPPPLPSSPGAASSASLPARWNDDVGLQLEEPGSPESGMAGVGLSGFATRGRPAGMRPPVVPAPRASSRLRTESEFGQVRNRDDSPHSMGTGARGSPYGDARPNGSTSRFNLSLPGLGSSHQNTSEVSLGGTSRKSRRPSFRNVLGGPLKRAFSNDRKSLSSPVEAMDPMPFSVEAGAAEALLGSPSSADMETLANSPPMLETPTLVPVLSNDSADGSLSGILDAYGGFSASPAEETTLRPPWDNSPQPAATPASLPSHSSPTAADESATTASESPKSSSNGSPAKSSSFFSKLRKPRASGGSRRASDAVSILTRKSSGTGSLRSPPRTSEAVPVVPPLPTPTSPPTLQSPVQVTTNKPKRPGPTTLITNVLKGRERGSPPDERRQGSFEVKSFHNVRNPSVSSTTSLVSPTDILNSYAAISPPAGVPASSTEEIDSTRVSPPSASPYGTSGRNSPAAGGPRISAAVFRERAAMRSSVSSLSSSRSDFAEHTGVGENRFLDSPRSARLGLGLPSPAARSTSSDLGLPTRAGLAKTPPGGRTPPRRNVTMPVEPLIKRIPPLEQQGILKSPKSDEEEVLAPPRPAFYGHQPSSSSSLSSSRSEGARGRNASFDNVSEHGYTHAPRSASPAGSVRSNGSPLPSALKGSRALQNALLQPQSPQVRPTDVSPAGKLSPLPSPGEIDSQRSSLDGWHTAVGGSSSESLEEVDGPGSQPRSGLFPGAADTNTTRWPGTPGKRPAVHSRNASFQSARSNLTATPAPSPTKSSTLLPSAAIDSPNGVVAVGTAGAAKDGGDSSDEDEVPLSRLRKKSQQTLNGRPSLADLAVPHQSPASQATPQQTASASPKPAPSPLKIAPAMGSSPLGTPPASPRALRSMAQRDSPLIREDELRSAVFSDKGGALDVIRPEPSSPQRASRVPAHGRSMSALSTSSGVSKTDSTVTEATARPGALPFANASSAPAVPRIDTMVPVPIPQAPFMAAARATDTRPRGYSPASSSSGSGSGSGTWSMPLTPRDVTSPVLPANLGATAKPRVTFDPSIVDKSGPRRVGQPLFSGGLGAPPRGGMRRSSFAGNNEQPERPLRNAWRSISDMRDVATDGAQARQHSESARGAVAVQDESDDDEALGAALQRKGITPTASMAQISAQTQSPAPILKSHASAASLGSMPAPPGVDPYLFASLPVDQKMQLHQRSQYMMQMMAAQAQAQAAASAQMQAYAMSNVGIGQPDNWETRSVMSGPAGPQMMMGYGMYPAGPGGGHRQMPSYGSGFFHPGMMGAWPGSASAVGMPAHRTTSSVNLSRLPASPSTGQHGGGNRLRFETR